VFPLCYPNCVVQIGSRTGVQTLLSAICNLPYPIGLIKPVICDETQHSAWCVLNALACCFCSAKFCCLQWPLFCMQAPRSFPHSKLLSRILPPGGPRHLDPPTTSFLFREHMGSVFLNLRVAGRDNSSVMSGWRECDEHISLLPPA
jgi:hypothetical protein